MLLKSNEACQDMDNIWLYIALDNPNAADLLIEDIDSKFYILEANPYLGKIAENICLAPREIRQFSVRNYLILYSPIEQGVEIIRIVHGAMDIDNIF